MDVLVIRDLDWKVIWLHIKSFYDRSIPNKLITAGATIFALSTIRYTYCKIHRKFNALPNGLHICLNPSEIPDVHLLSLTLSRPSRTAHIRQLIRLWIEPKELPRQTR